MSAVEKSLHIRLFEANDYPVRLAALEDAAVSLMEAGFTDQARSVMEVYADFMDYVLDNGLDILLAEGIDNLKEAVSDRMQTKLRFKKLKMKHKTTKKKWLCCKKPRLKKQRASGKRVWMSTCRYRDLRSRRIRVMNMMLGKDTSKKPKFVTVQGKKMRWCTGQNAK